MNNIIINGIPEDGFYSEFEKELEASIDQSDYYFKLREMKIGYCQGCWDCWVKTPGICRIRDDYERILSRIPKAERIIIITPIIAGYESALVKRFKDRIIPYAHPYIISHEGEQHHKKRYESKAPSFTVVALRDEHTSDRDIEILKELYGRVTLNFHSEVNRIETYMKGEEMGNVINCL